VLRATLIVAAESVSRAYGETNPALSGTITGLIDGDFFTAHYTTSAMATSPVGSYDIVPVFYRTLAMKPNYDVVVVPGTLTVIPAALTVAADAQTKVAGNDDPQLTWQITSGALVEGDSVTGQLMRAAGEDPGTYSIGQGTLSAGGNYDLTFVGADLTITPAQVDVESLSISGQTLQDITGNGLSADDIALGGVTVKLFKESDGNTGLDRRDALVMTVVSDAAGAYSFSDLAPGRYYVREVAPCGFIRTEPGRPRYYAADLASANIGGLDFANFQKLHFDVRNVTYTITGANGRTRKVCDLRGNTHAGDTVAVTFTVSGLAKGAKALVTLVTYSLPTAGVQTSTASQLAIYQQDSELLGNGRYTLTIKVPQNPYQIYFVKGAVIDRIGTPGSRISYWAQDRLIDGDYTGAAAFWKHFGFGQLGKRKIAGCLR
jgi:hypothetical protein